MLVLVSPAKTLDYESELNVKDFSIASHLSDSNLLMKELQKNWVAQDLVDVVVA